MGFNFGILSFLGLCPISTDSPTKVACNVNVNLGASKTTKKVPSEAPSPSLILFVFGPGLWDCVYGLKSVILSHSIWMNSCKERYFSTKHNFHVGLENGSILNVEEVYSLHSGKT